jgi:salicylate hydroxylase
MLHLPDGPMADARNQKVTRVPQNFGWIHEYDVQQELQKIGSPPPASSASFEQHERN